MPSKTGETTAPSRHIFTRSGITLTPIHIPKSRSETSPIEWVHAKDASRKPFDWASTGMGYNFAFEDEEFRTRLPVELGAGLEKVPLPDWSFPPSPLFFSENARGAPMEEILRWDLGAQQLIWRGVKWSKKVDDRIYARKFCLRIRWPEEEREWNYIVTPDGTYGSVAVAVARAYEKFLKCDARAHDWSKHTNSPWYVAKFDISSLYLQALFWVGQTGPARRRMDVFEADVHLVFKVELSDQPALFWSRHSVNCDKLPVIVFIFGGGFTIGLSSQMPGDVVVAQSVQLGKPVIYVALNYRLHAFGLLGGKEVEEAGVGNLEREALRWVQKYISAFGGDPKKVTICSGAISPALQMVTNGGNTEGLFPGAIMNAGSPIPTGDIAEQQQYHGQFVQHASCSNATLLTAFATSRLRLWSLKSHAAELF
ncbi:Carboxylesterase family-domain-containing protein [Cerioporus squamosus]|nr:Carboxylesterase family-domain-containing protein [Cerioporus squamosus]